MTPIFEHIVNNYKITNVLDVGCGNGFYSCYFSERGHDVKGIDGSQYGLEWAKERGIKDTYLIKDFDHYKLPYEDNTFSFIICKDLLEHLYYPKNLLNEIHRVLAPNGICLVLVPNHFPILMRLKFLFTLNIDTQRFFPEASEWDLPHIRFFTQKGLLWGLDKCGFKPIMNYAKYFPFIFRGGNRIPLVRTVISWFAKIWPVHFATAFVYLIEKKQKDLNTQTSSSNERPENQNPSPENSQQSSAFNLPIN